MRSLLIFPTAAALLVLGCGAPSVDVPAGNNNATSDTKVEKLVAPTVEDVPKSYPYARIALRGNAGNGTIRVLVKGAGNPVTAPVQPVNFDFCVNVDLAAAPAEYTLTLQSMAGDGALSAETTVTVNRSNDAPAPPNAKLCDGSPAGDGEEE
jgi:hypothetical protein